MPCRPVGRPRTRAPSCKPTSPRELILSKPAQSDARSPATSVAARRLAASHLGQKRAIVRHCRQIYRDCETSLRACQIASEPVGYWLRVETLAAGQAGRQAAEAHTHMGVACVLLAVSCERCTLVTVCVNNATGPRVDAASPCLCSRR